MRKTLKNLLYASPIILASFLPIKQANAQKIASNTFKRWDADKEIKIERPNALYAGVELGRQPIQGFNIGYSRKINSRFGSYISLSRGKYESIFNSEDFDSHVNYTSISLGGMIHSGKDSNGLSAFVSFGPLYNFLNKRDYVPGTMDEKAFKKLSYEGGAGMVFPRNFTVSFKFNPVLGQGKIHFGFQFGHH